MEEEIKIKKMP